MNDPGQNRSYARLSLYVQRMAWIVTFVLEKRRD